MDSYWKPLPYEIQGIILQHQATSILKAKCSKLGLDFSQLITFLQITKGAIVGSTALSCFIPQLSVPHLEIMIIGHPYSLNWLRGNFFPKTTIFFHCPNNDISHPSLGLLSQTYELGSKGIIIKVLPVGKYDGVDQFLENYCTLECERITYNGIEWSLPFQDLAGFINHRECKIYPRVNNFFTERLSFTPVKEQYLITNQIPYLKYHLAQYETYYDKYTGPIFGSNPRIYATTQLKNILQTLLYRIINYSRVGLRITNLKSINRGFPQKLINELITQEIHHRLT